MNRAFVVVGPESSGNRYVTRMLVSGGCIGHGNVHQPLVDATGIDWRITVPDPGDKPLAFFRSFPHGRTSDGWPNMEQIDSQLRSARYEPFYLVCVRNWAATIKSQVAVGHVQSEHEARRNVTDGLKRIFRFIAENDVNWILIPYASLESEAARLWILSDLGLDATCDLEEFRNQNAKYE